MNSSKGCSDIVKANMHRIFGAGIPEIVPAGIIVGKQKNAASKVNAHFFFVLLKLVFDTKKPTINEIKNTHIIVAINNNAIS